MKEVALCGTLKFFSGYSFWFCIVNGLSISINSGLWTAIIDAVNDELVYVFPVIFLTKLWLTLGTALKIPPSNSALNGSPEVFLTNVPCPAKFGSTDSSGSEGCVSISGGTVSPLPIPWIDLYIASLSAVVSAGLSTAWFFVFWLYVVTDGMIGEFGFGNVLPLTSWVDASLTSEGFPKALAFAS